MSWLDGLALVVLREHRRTRFVLTALILTVLGVAAALIRRVPTPFADVQLYASISLARQLYGVGIPTISWNSPVAVDHIPFYGPVFFDLAAASLAAFGFTLFSFRLVSVLGTLLFLAAAGLLARRLNEAGDRWLWAVALLSLTPEVNAGVTTGAMHMVAVALGVLALAVFLAALESPGRRPWYSVGAGALFAAAALTTPRSYPLIFGFLCAGTILPGMSSDRRRAARLSLAITVITLAVAMAAWATASQGNPGRWLRYVTFILTHEDTDVALLPTAVRAWSFSWTNALTPAVALAGAFAVARSLRQEDDDATNGATGRTAFLLLATWIGCVTTIAGMNLTFTVGEYFALPLMAAVVAAPHARLNVSRRVIAASVLCVIVCDAGLLALKYARVAATWAARDPTPLNEFMRAHVPEHSEVIGPEAPYFFPVERSGSRYRTVSARSWADWARWVPLIEPDATKLKWQFPMSATTTRFLIWPSGDDLPDRYECARNRVVALYHRPPDDLALLGPLGHPVDMGYPESVLYRLDPGCPRGYDPTVAH